MGYREEALRALEGKLARAEKALRAAVEERRRAGPPAIGAMQMQVVRDGAVRAHWTPGGLTLHDAEERPRLGFGATPDGRPIVFIAAASSSARVLLETANNECPRLLLTDGEGSSRIEAVVDPRSAPSLHVADREGTPRAVLLVTAQGQGKIAPSAGG